MKGRKGALCRKTPVCCFKARRKGGKYGIPVELKGVQDAWGIEWERELRLEK